MNQNNNFSEIFDIYDKTDYTIDREQENKDVERFQQTGDLNLLEQIYIKRIPTLKNWARLHYHPGLEPTIDDFMEELSIVFIKAASKYVRKKGSFNTCLYTFLTNRIKNMKNSTHAKKRRSDGYDGPISGMILSLDYTYSHDKKYGMTSNPVDNLNSNGSLMDLVSCHNIDGNSMDFIDSINILSENNAVLRDAFKKIGEGCTVSAVIRELNIKNGEIEFFQEETRENIINKIKNNIKTDKFKLLKYEILENKLFYEIELKESKETQLLKRAIKYLRRNKKNYIKKIRD